MSCGVENFACVIGLNRFKTASQGGFGEINSFNGQCGHTKTG